MRHLLVAAALFGTLTVPALAQETERYRLERTDTGFVRMDTSTGQMSVCEERSGQLVCRTSTDERAAYEERIDDLERRVEALERQAGASNDATDALPSEEEFERSLGYMKRFFQNFFDIVEDWERGLRSPQDEPAPDRT
ncbi:DUF4988 domain-containing protein [Aliihoeflea sp. 40Bstr573]|uniref:DUF4988 domain-containing protein n=1 Tax=Aliihoeflea sp. 40Bstr573 TaxID=2696467 RepID=UPI0020952CF6|nr:DUF4988 domain-containing protein [Aliihoeflea sp. 40Bstr573]MCO6389072.1 hypothetical protein [Aliihoeflea sp. 40Bstr573]